MPRYCGPALSSLLLKVDGMAELVLHINREMLLSADLALADAELRRACRGYLGFITKGGRGSCARYVGARS